MTNPLRRRPCPHLLEVPIRPWLRRVSRELGREAHFEDLPESELAAIRARGFDAIWLMGVWPTGPKARRLAQSYPGLRRAYDQLLPGWQPEDVDGSPYSIEAYEPPDRNGGRESLMEMRRKFHAHGLGLVLDFVPNHIGIDHAWLNEQPDFLVRGAAPDFTRDPGNWFVHESGGEERVFAHGRDPYFPGWTDTAQVDFRRAAARRAMTASLLDVAQLADGLRCDMAMLALPDIFARTWGPYAGEAPGDFWAEAIPALRARVPEIALIAEVYWGLGPRLLAAGFDWVYDKDIRDALLAGDFAATRRAMEGEPGRVLFLENHDEERAPIAFGPRDAAAAVTLYGLPGLRFFFEGQTTGGTLRIPVQLSRAPGDVPDADRARFYEGLLAFLDDDVVHVGQHRILDALGPSGAKEPGVFTSLWTDGKRVRLLIANLETREARVTVPWPEAAEALRDLGGDSSLERHLKASSQAAIELSLPSFGWRLLRTPD